MSGFGATPQSGERRGERKNQANTNIKHGERRRMEVVRVAGRVWGGGGAHQEFHLMRTVTMVTASVRLLHVMRRSGGSDIFQDVLQLLDEVSTWFACVW